MIPAVADVEKFLHRIPLMTTNLLLNDRYFCIADLLTTPHNLEHWKSADVNICTFFIENNRHRNGFVKAIACT